MEHNEKKRPHSIFDSPSKPTSFQPQHQSQPAQSPFRAPSFTTPRKPAVEIDFSSGPENQSSPEQADNEDTPESVKPIPYQFTSNESKGKRNSLFGLYGRFAPPSSGRGEIPRTKRPDALERKVHKRRRKGERFDRQLLISRRGSEDTTDGEGSPTEAKAFTGAAPPQQPPQQSGFLGNMFTFIERHPEAPGLLAKYMQLAFNFMILSGCLYAVYSFWSTIQSDVNKASQEAITEALAEARECGANYVANRCGSEGRPPALEPVCHNWELCMARDTDSVARARMSARTFAEILNSFVEPISLKTMIFSLMVIVVSLFVSNTTFGIVRRNLAEHQVADSHRHPSGSYPAPGQLPYGMGQYGRYGQDLEWHQGGPGNGWAAPGMQQVGGREDYERARSRSPQKRLAAR